MGKYVLAYKGGSIPQTEEEQKRVMDAWTAWFGGLGDSVVDMGNPFGAAGRGRRRRHVGPHRLLDPRTRPASTRRSRRRRPARSSTAPRRRRGLRDARDVARRTRRPEPSRAPRLRPPAGCGSSGHPGCLTPGAMSRSQDGVPAPALARRTAGAATRARPRPSAARPPWRPRRRCPARSTHSRTEWNSLPPAKMFGVGRPISVSREPSVPPRIECSVGSTPARRAASSAASTTCGASVEPVAHVAVLLPALERDARARLARDRLLGQPPHERLALEQHVPLEVADDQRDRDRAGAALDRRCGWTNPSRPSVVSGERLSVGRLATNRAASLIGLTSFPFAVPGCTPTPWKVTFSSSADHVSFSISPTTEPSSV